MPHRSLIRALPPPSNPPWCWATVHNDTAGNTHRVPTHDLEHHAWVGCRCQPLDDGEIIIHNAFDERERYEAGTRRPH